MAFGVKTTNMFELLGDEDEVAAPPKAVVKPQTDSKKPTPALSGAANVEARMKGGVANGTVNNTGRGEGRGGRGRGRGGRGFDRQREGGEGGEGGGGGDGERGSRPYRGRGGGGRHFERDVNRRGYDRHDGTGRGHETEKRGGQGGHNWGAPGDEEENTAAATTGGAAWPDEEAPEQPTQAAEAPTTTEAPAATEAETPAEAAEPEEPEKEEMTLDEYEKLQEEKRASLKKKPATAVKVDTKAFEGMKAYNRKDVPDDNELSLSGKKQQGKPKAGDKARKEKELLPTGFRVGSAESGGRGRGRGGGERGGRFNDRFGDRPERERPPRRTSDENGGRGYGRGYGRSDRPFSGGRGRGRDGQPPTLEDSNAFPTLGA